MGLDGSDTDDGDDRSTLRSVDSRGESSRNLTYLRSDSPSIGSNQRFGVVESSAERMLERQITL